MAEDSIKLIPQKGSEFPVSPNPKNMTFMGFSKVGNKEVSTRISFEEMTPLFGVENSLGQSLTNTINQKTVTDNFSKKTNKSEIFNSSQFHNKYNFASRFYARASVPEQVRGVGQLITYQLTTGEWIVEQFLGGEWIDENFKEFPTADAIPNNPITNSLGNRETEIISQDLLTNSLQGYRLTYNYSHLWAGADGAGQPVQACVSNGVDYYIVRTFTAPSSHNIFVVEKNGEVLSTTARPNTLQIGRIACEMKDGVIHIVVSNNQYYGDATKDGYCHYYQFDTITNETKLISTFRLNEVLPNFIVQCWSLKFFKNELYLTLSHEYTATADISLFTQIYLYKFDSVANTFLRVTILANDTDVWGASITDAGVEYRSLPATGYVRATLSVSGDYMYCTYVGNNRHSGVKNFVFTKKSQDGAWWYNDEILSNARCNVSFVAHYQGEKIYLSKAYITNQFKYAETDTAFCLNGMHRKGYVGVLPFLEKYGKTVNNNIMMYELDEEIVLSSSYLVSSSKGSGITMISIPKKEIYEMLRGKFYEDKGLTLYSRKDSKVGDAYEVGSEVNELKIPTYTFPYVATVRQEYLNLGKGEKARIVNNGSQMGWCVSVLKQGNSRQNSIVFEHNPQFNPYHSHIFRLPCVTPSVDGTILFATADIRYLTGNDKDLIDVGFCRSLDGGRTWQNYLKIFERDSSINKWNRVHDCVLCVDRNPKSAHYGRLWAFAKRINTDQEEWMWQTGDVQILAKYSDDNGLTWSDSIDLTHLIPTDATQKSMGVSPGITMTDGTLVVSTYFTRVENSVTVQRASFIYSTDGETWQAGDITPMQGGENAIIQLPTGELMMNARLHYVTPHKRQVYTLSSIGAGWVNRPEYEVWTTDSCQESLVYNRGVYLYCQPTGYLTGARRVNITIFKSKDLINWEKVTAVTVKHSFGYSTLVFTDNTLGVIYEDEEPNYDISYANLDYLLPFIYS